MAFNYDKVFVKTEIERIIRKNSPGTQKFFRNAASARLIGYKNNLLEEYEDSSITKEIRGGPTAENESGTLDENGNLFSFIGFDSDAGNPAEEFADYLDGRITLENTGKYYSDGQGTRIEFNVLAPTKEEIESAFPMPWEPGSWVFKVSEGISGLGEYIFHKFLPKPPSRSTTGLQMKYEVREGEFRPQPYFSKMFKKFLDKIRKKN